MKIRAREVQIADCFFGVGQATAFLARAGLAINAATKSCNEEAFEAKGYEAHRVCAINVMGIVGAFSLATGFIAKSVNNCPWENNAGARCAGDIALLTGGLTSIF